MLGSIQECAEQRQATESRVDDQHTKERTKLSYWTTLLQNMARGEQLTTILLDMAWDSSLSATTTAGTCWTMSGGPWGRWGETGLAV